MLVTTAAAAASLTGCVGSVGGDAGSSEGSFELTLVDGGDGGSITVTPGSDGVISVPVGTAATIAISNELGGAVGVHDHVTGEEFTVDPADRTVSEFTAEEEMIGRHEIAGWIAEEGSEHGEGHEGTRDAGDGGHHHTVTLATVEVRPA